MKNLREYGISDGEWIKHTSKLCGIAYTIDFPHSTSLALAINELCFSYFNQWRFVVDAYEKLATINSNLKDCNDQPITHSILSNYDILASESESSCRDYFYLMVTSMKSLLDLAACLIDVIVNQTIRPENAMVDIATVSKKLSKKNAPGVHQMMEGFLNKEQYPWIEVIKVTRNRLIHRGYTAKPKFGLNKSNEMIISLIKGNDHYTGGTIEVGSLFHNFITGLYEMEEVIGACLLTSIPELVHGQLVQASYKTDGIIQHYSGTEINK